MAASLPTAQAGDPVINFADDDAQMNAAIGDARETLPGFWKRFDARETGDKGFSLKVRITEGEVDEHIWTGDIERDGGNLSAVIGNEPANLKSVKLGERITIDPGRITDWMYIDIADRIHGAYTLRVMLPHMPRETANDFRRRLAPVE